MRLLSMFSSRAFHYNWQRYECQLLTVTQNSPHIRLQRNVHYDLYQKKGRLKVCVEVKDQGVPIVQEKENENVHLCFLCPDDLGMLI